MIPAVFATCMNLDDVNTDFWSKIFLSGCPMYQVVHIFSSVYHTALRELLGSIVATENWSLCQQYLVRGSVQVYDNLCDYGNACAILRKCFFKGLGLR